MRLSLLQAGNENRVITKKFLNSVKFFFKLKKFSELEFSLLGYFYLCPFAPTKGNSRLLFFSIK